MIEIDKMLYEASVKGYTTRDIKESILNVLSPFFDNKEALHKFACEGQMLSIFEFFIKYHYDEAFVDGINHVLKCYKDAYHTNKNEFWDIVLCSYDKMVNDENKMWTVRKKVVNIDSDDVYEKIITYMNHIGANLEITAKHITQELYALICISKNKNVDYTAICKLDFGVVINNILNQNLLNNELITLPSQIKLSEWRNIAYHHSYSVSGNKLKCFYGKKIVKDIELTMEEFESYVYQIIRTCNIFTIARCIFVFDYNFDIPKNYKLNKADFREPMMIDQLRIALLGQQFNLCNIQVDCDKIEVDFFDLLVNANTKDRTIHCSQLLYQIWKVWKRPEVVINYFNNDGNKVCRLNIKGDVCEAYFKGEKDISYLAEQFEISN